MPSNYSIPPYSPYSPPDQQSNAASQSPWSASSTTGSGYESLTLPPINPDQYQNQHPNDDNNYDFINDGEQYYDSLPRLPSREPYLPEPSNSHQQQQQPPPPPSNQQARHNLQQIEQSSRRRSEYEVEPSESPDPFEDFIEQDFEYQPSPRPQLQQQQQQPPQPQPYPYPHPHPHSHSQPQPSQNTTRASSVVDLTETSPPPENMPPTRKRKADIPGEGRSAPQRALTPVPKSATPSRKKQKINQADVVDLVDIDDEEQYADFHAKQQAEAIKRQQQDEANKPVKLAEFQCIICMDNPTDLTVTHCGHLFCSECLHQALYAGNAKKCCPVCRTAISTTLLGKDKKQPKNGIFALEMKLMTANKKGKQPVRAR